MDKGLNKVIHKENMSSQHEKKKFKYTNNQISIEIYLFLLIDWKFALNYNIHKMMQQVFSFRNINIM